MNNKAFEQELEGLQTQFNKIPSRAFCKKFFQRLPAQSRIPEEYLGRDAEDYYSWGWALWRSWENAEGAMGDLQLMEWIELYDAIDSGDLNRVREASNELWEQV